MPPPGQESTRAQRTLRLSPTEFLARRLLPRILTVARRVTPTLSHVFISGFPSTEGNTVETVRALLNRYPGNIFWADPPSTPYLHDLGFDNAKIKAVKKGSPLAFIAYTTAAAVFFTHGLYGEPNALARKPTINLWHGGGMKMSERLFNMRTQRGKASDFIVGATHLWGKRTADLSGMSAEETIFSGYPRNDDLFRELTTSQYAVLGISPERQFIVWMPSFRQSAEGRASQAFDDTTDPEADRSLASWFVTIADAFRNVGIDVVVKPHPMDAIARNVPGAIQATNDLLEANSIPLYRLLGASSGLITDTSSVWSDYLLLDKPIGFFFPDKESYIEGRGVYPTDIFGWLPGPELDSDDRLNEFIKDVQVGGTATKSQRESCRMRAGLIQTATAGDDLLDHLARRSTSKFARLIQARKDT